MRRNDTAINIALLVLRIFLGVTFIMHGSQKMFGAFDGPGLAGVVKQMGPIGYLVSIGEFFGGIGILLGILPRFCAAAIVTIMVGAIVKVHLANGFFAPKGFELPFNLIGPALAILIAGPGAYAVCAKVRWLRL